MYEVQRWFLNINQCEEVNFIHVLRYIFELSPSDFFMNKVYHFFIFKYWVFSILFSLYKFILYYLCYVYINQCHKNKLIFYSIYVIWIQFIWESINKMHKDAITTFSLQVHFRKKNPEENISYLEEKHTWNWIKSSAPFLI